MRDVRGNHMSRVVGMRSGLPISERPLTPPKSEVVAEKATTTDEVKEVKTEKKANRKKR